MPLINAMKRSLENHNDMSSNINLFSNNNNNANDDDNDDDNDINLLAILENEPHFASTIMPQNLLLNDQHQILPSNLPSQNTAHIHECPIKHCYAVLQSEPLLTQHISTNHKPVLALIQRARALNNPNNNNSAQPSTDIPDAPSSKNPISISNNDNNNNNNNHHHKKNMSNPPTSEQGTLWFFYQCSECPLKTNYRWEIIDHTTKAHNASFSLEKCTSYLHSTTKDTDHAKRLMADDLKNHQDALKLHESLPDCKFPILTCPYESCKDSPLFSSISALKTHISSIHLHLRYVCQYAGCKISTSQPYELKRHAIAKHVVSQINPIDCLRWEGKQDPLKNTSPSDQNK
jgi:hypothetical protein